jgi:hypothetical protein
VKTRGGPAAVTGYESRISTVRFKPGGKDGRRMTREPEDELLGLGKLMEKAALHLKRC